MRIAVVSAGVRLAPFSGRIPGSYQENPMTHQKHSSCIEACDECAAACSHCAVACLNEPDVKSMSRCIALDMDCAEICRLASAAMARGSPHAEAICAVCADICEACAEECAKHQMDHCQACASACKRCAEECRAMAETSGARAPIK